MTRVKFIEAKIILRADIDAERMSALCRRIVTLVQSNFKKNEAIQYKVQCWDVELEPADKEAK